MSVAFSILNIFLILIMVLLALFVMLLFIPFGYDISGKGIGGGIYGTTYVSWLYGGIKFGIFKEENSKGRITANIFGIKILPQNIKKEEKHSHKKKKDSKQKNKKNKFTGYVIRLIWNYCTDMINIVKPKKLSINGVYGFEDPSLTGYLCGVISIISKIVPYYDINLQPCFEESSFDIDVEVKGQMYLSVIGFKTLRLILKKDIRKLIFKNKKKR